MLQKINNLEELSDLQKTRSVNKKIFMHFLT